MSPNASFICNVLVGILTPLILVPIHYAVQGHRIDEFQGMGCFVPVYPSYPALFLVMTYPIVVTLVSTVYGSKCILSNVLVLALRSFFIRRHQFNAILRERASGINTSTYLKLVVLGSLNLFIWLPLSISFLATIFTTYSVLPYDNWSTVHAEFDFIGFYYPSQLPHAIVVMSELARWTGPLIGVLFFFLFGINQDHWKQVSTCVFELSNAISRWKHRDLDLEYGSAGSREEKGISRDDISSNNKQESNELDKSDVKSLASCFDDMDSNRSI